MCVPGAIAATSAAIVRMKPADAARAPDGPTKTATGVSRGKHVRDDVARGIDQAARRPQREDDERRARAIGPIDRLDHVFRRDRMDDAVEFRDEGERGVHCCLRRRQLRGRQEDQSREQSSPHVEIVCPTRSRGTGFAAVTSACADLCAKSESGDDSYENPEEFGFKPRCRRGGTVARLRHQ